MNYFKTVVTCVLASITAILVVSANYSMGNPCADSNSEVQTVESVHVDEKKLEHASLYDKEEQNKDEFTESDFTTMTLDYPYELDIVTMSGYSTANVSIEEEIASSVSADVLTEKDEPSITCESFAADTYQVNKSYNIPVEFYYSVLPEEMHILAESVCELERTQEISSMFLIAVAATEVGWHGEFAGENNWFNWTPDAEYYQGFASTEECVAYTGRRFKESFFNPEWYAGFGQEMDDYFTIAEINSRYAFYNDSSVNWYWGEVVTEILESLNTKYMRWVAENYG